MAAKTPYFEAVRDVYVRTACDFYKLAIDADYETADAANLIARGRTAENLAHESWPVSTRADRRMSSLRAAAELNTPAGRAYRDRIIAALAANDRRPA